MGISKMKAMARGLIWWPGIDKEIENLGKTCHDCLAVKQSPPKAPLQPWIWPSRPWQRLHIDFAGPFINKNFLIVVDAHSKWAEVSRVCHICTTTSKTIKVLRNLVCTAWYSRAGSIR